MTNLILDSLVYLGKQTHWQFRVFAAGYKKFLAKEQQKAQEANIEWSRYLFINRYMAKRMYDIHFDIHLAFEVDYPMAFMIVKNRMTFEELRDVIVEGLEGVGRYQAITYTEEDIARLYNFMYKHDFDPIVFDDATVYIRSHPNEYIEGRLPELIDIYQTTVYSRFKPRKHKKTSITPCGL